MESNIPYFSLLFLDPEASELGFNKIKSQECDYEELHPILPSQGSLLGPDDVLAQFLYGDEPLEEPDLNGPTTLYCEICRKQFDNAKKYYGHLRVHCKENKWTCDKCPNEKFSTKQLLMNHSLTHKPLHRVWKCHQCTMSFEALWRLQQHLFAKHLDYRPYKCQVCEKSFHKQSDLDKHENVYNGMKNYSCSFCKKVFTDKSNLKRHILTHTKEKPYCCPNCGNRFQQIASLNRHRKKCTAHNNQLGSVETVDKTTRKNYCRVCGLVFQYKSALIEHCVRAHTNNTPKEKEKEKDDKMNQINNESQGTEANIVDDILSAEGDYITMNTPNDNSNTCNQQYDAANIDNLMQFELLKDMNQLHMLDDELLLNDIDFDSLQTNHIFTKDIDCPVDKTPEVLFDAADCGRSLDQDLMNSLYQVKAEHLPDELLNVSSVLSTEDKTHEYFENPTITVNECATIFESDVDLDASTNLAANLNQLIGENTVRYIRTEDDDTFIISINSEIDAEKLTDMLNMGVGLVDEVIKPIENEDKDIENVGTVVDTELSNIGNIENIPNSEETKQSDEKAEKKVKIKKRKLYVCSNCDKLFTKKSNYESHIATHEPSLRRHTCKICNTKFSYKSTLNKHMQSHHTPGVYPSHACGICDKTYKAAWLLKCHMERDHEGIAEYKCNQTDCNKKFYKKSDLDKHERTHTGVRPYVCEACNRSYGQSSHLKRHERSCSIRKKLSKKKKRPMPNLHPR